MIIWLFISTGVFLGWSLGANHAVNVFGTAVASRMVRFRTAAVLSGIFVVLGAVLSGEGTTRTLNTLGAVNAIAGCFTVALAVGLTVAWMTKLTLPVSTSQAVVGGIIGWNLFTGSPTDTSSLSKIVSTWVIGPVLAAFFAFALFWLATGFLKNARMHILHVDAWTRVGLIIGGALAAYMLGANNIANVMGMFVSASPLADFSFLNMPSVSGTQQLFLIGGLAIAVGMYTYGERVMDTVGRDLYKVTPLAGLVVVLAETLVLFLVTSEWLEGVLAGAGLPTIPLVPLSSTQVVIGAVIGVGLAKGGRGINYRVLLRIAWGWVIAPVIAGITAFILLFFVQNVFEQQVVRRTEYRLDAAVMEELSRRGLDTTALASLSGASIEGASEFRQILEKQRSWTEAQMMELFTAAEVDSIRVDSLVALTRLDSAALSPGQRRALFAIHGTAFAHRWQLNRTLQQGDPAWRIPDAKGSEAAAKRMRGIYSTLYTVFQKR
ncbi:MAG: inorganic phosphate transporter, PiT family [Bacteroidetes bacterium]|jgi:PiT family inorganic phosphate transporter|nr:inorganic phosphate transporter, PiT family [Bacteroidota bacterium]